MSASQSMNQGPACISNSGSGPNTNSAQFVLPKYAMVTGTKPPSVQDNQDSGSGNAVGPETLHDPFEMGRSFNK